MLKRRLTPLEHSSNKDLKLKIKRDYKAKVSIFRSISPVETFYKHESKSPDSNDPCYEYYNDIYFVLNQNRLDAMSLSDFQSVLNTNPTLSPLANIRAGMSDEQLHSFVKSRYIQHPAELLSWTNYLESQIDTALGQLSDPAAPADPAVPAESAE